MDVTSILDAQKAKQQNVTVEKETPLEIDAGHLMVSDLNPIDEESYNENLEEHLRALARDGTQALLAALFSLPTSKSADGPLAQLPPRTYQLPRQKALPKPKPPTKWERFAAAKGISHVKRDKKEWDEERQEWVNRWGKDGKNRRVEEQWLTEVKRNADPDHNPQLAARHERKERIAKNEKQHLANLARASGSSASGPSSRKAELEKSIATTRASTASMGKFDRKLDGEKKLRGVKRKFDPAERSVVDEQKSALKLIGSMDSDARKMRKAPRENEEGSVNARKAIRFASKGKGAASMAGGETRGKSSFAKGKKGGRR
ncbi:ribosome biogenesis regulatory protein-domain-containing protein [Ephemerocybe angulata]|uniref:Ribosome biogenesis regulatory protein n=1 Tax=Ephemerocybe angulata TaxID=980116 RepID=A0A8H6ICM1_9AGAR|nr:ribosome biogenesis regulatory protein-domain-containing protein [Tulosesus angulatus]